MTSGIDQITLGAAKLLNPTIYNTLQIHLASTFEEFLDSIYSMLDQVISILQENPQHYENNNEDQVTHHILSMFRIAGFNAYSDSETGGHVDIRIDKPGTNFLWLGEAKKDNNLSHVHEGFLQLTTRYATCGINQTEGCILIYIFKHPAIEYIQNCKGDLQKKDIDKLQILESPDKNPLSFFSLSHVPRMGKGIKYRVKHLGISLYFLPEDKSGRTAQKYKN